jgi:hypothetical protein
MVLFGGTAEVGFTNDTWEWDGSAWTQVADMGPAPRMYPVMTYDISRQRLILFGGVVAVGAALRLSGDTWERVGTEWTQVADTGPAPRQNCTLTYDTVRQRVVLFGGFDAAGNRFHDTWEWVGTEWVQIADTGPPGRFAPAMVYDRSREGLVLFGGNGSQDQWLNDTWEFTQGTPPQAMSGG